LYSACLPGTTVRATVTVTGSGAMRGNCAVSKGPESVSAIAAIKPRDDDCYSIGDNDHMRTKRSDCPVDLGNVSVQALDLVVHTNFLGEDVHHHVTEVHQHPLLLRRTLDA